MTEKEKELLLSWIVNEQLRLDDELLQLRQRVRFRKIDISDNDLQVCILAEEDYSILCPANPPEDENSDSDFPVFGDGYFVC